MIACRQIIIHPLSLLAFIMLANLGQFVACQQSTTNAKLMVDKEIMNKYIVEGRDIVVNYHLINIGGSVARDIKIIDDTFPSDRFEIVNGYTSFTIDKVEPSTNVTSTVILRPKSNSWGPHRFGPAKVEYKCNDANQLQLATTSELGEAYVVAARTFDRKFSSQLFDWLFFVILCTPSVLGPYYLWYQSDSKYNNLAAKQANVKKLH